MLTMIPWEHQTRVISQARELPYLGIFHEMGTGKTFSMIKILEEIFIKKREILKTLIFCPKIVLNNWKDELSKFSDIPEAFYHILYGRGTDRLSLFTSKIASNPKQIFITNYESSIMPNLREAFTKWQPEVIICDELHRLKNIKAARTKAIIKLSQDSSFRFGLTGTPILNNMLDLWSQIYFLDRGKSLGNSFFSFRARFMMDKNAGMPKQRYFPNFVPQPGAYERLNKLIQPFTSRVRKEECLDLPPLVETVIKVEMSPEQKKIYEEMKKDFITFIEGKEVVALMALTKLLRLQQIASGFCRTFQGTDIEIKDNTKAEALSELLEDLAQSNKVIVWCAWTANYSTVAAICKQLGLSYRELHGGTKDVFKVVEDFRTDPSVSVLIANPEAGGIGVNLIEAKYAIYYSRSFSLEHREQSLARNYRGGSEMHDKVTIIDLVTRGTVDELILQKLKEKKEIGASIIDAMREDKNLLEAVDKP